MVTLIEPPTGHEAQAAPWYSSPPELVAAEFGVEPAVGLPEFRAAELLAMDGPNTLPEEAPRPGWQRFLAQYRNYMQVILVAAAIVSALIGQWSTTVLLLVLTALCLIVAAVECRNATESALTTATFDSKQMNWVLLGEFVLAVLSTQMDALQHLLGTVRITLPQFAWALVPAVALLALWELGKLVARRSSIPRIQFSSVLAEYETHFTWAG
ncbi:MAG TPA: cation-transporting P-type ATPase [Pseudonocardiaceae bacterium]